MADPRPEAAGRTAREAFEEAGLIGTISSKHPIGAYHYIDADRDTVCHVRVFLPSVDHQADEWPEMLQRECRWVDPTEAADRVQEGGPAEILSAALHQSIGRTQNICAAPILPR